MIRRNLLVACAAGAGALPALVRAAGAQQAMTGGSAAADRTANAQLGAMAFALATSQLADERASNATVKAFAQLEREEQTAFAEARRMVNLPAPAPSMMDSQKQQMLQQLQGLRGAEFDRMYVQGQVTGHQELLQIHETMARSGSRPEERVLATVAVPAIKTHLAMLQSIQQTRS